MAVSKKIAVGNFNMLAYLMVGTVALDFVRETTTVDYVVFPDKGLRDRYRDARASRVERDDILQARRADVSRLADEAVAEKEMKAALEARDTAYREFQAANQAEMEAFGSYHKTATFDGLITDRAKLYELSKAAGQVLDQGEDV